MRWSIFAVVLCGVLCSVKSQEPDVEEPILDIMARNSVYNVGETKAIFCKGKNIVEPIEWFSPAGKKIEGRSNKNTRVYVEKKTGDEDEVLVPLIIHHIKITDSGNWTCKAGDFSDSLDIIVGQKVNITERNATIEGEEGRSVRMTCNAVGHPTPTVVWYRNNSPISNASKEDAKKYVFRGDNSLEIKRLTHMDVGTYVCKVRQKLLSHYTDKTVHLSVQHKPILYNSHTQQLYTMKFKTEEVYAILNETKNITCSAIANPPPTFRWVRRKNSFDNDEDPIVDPETVMTSEDGTHSVLVLRMHDESYLGEYKCTANNSKGSESIVFHVSLGTRPDPPDFVKLVAANVTKLTFNVTCSSCIMKTEDDISPDPRNLTVLGFSFELVQHKADYPPDWDGEKFSQDVYIVDSDDTLFTVGPLANSTEFHVRVRTVNAAGYSDWFESDAIVKTTSDVIRNSAMLSLVIACLVFICCY